MTGAQRLLPLLFFFPLHLFYFLCPLSRYKVFFPTMTLFTRSDSKIKKNGWSAAEWMDGKDNGVMDKVIRY